MESVNKKAALNDGERIANAPLREKPAVISLSNAPVAIFIRE